MVSRVVVIETRLNSTSDLVSYLKTSITLYSAMYRKIWHEMVKTDFTLKYKNLSEFQKHCRNIYDLHSRTINSIVHEIIAKKNAYMELKKTELNTIEQKIKKLRHNIKNA